MNCPKCSAEIKRFDLSPNCKKCGVHIMYYTQEEDLARDAKKTELEFTTARVIVAKLKAAFIGGKIQIARIVFILLCVAVLLLPAYNISLSFPWWEYELSVGALGIYNIISDSFWQLFDAIAGIDTLRGLFTVMAASFSMLVLTALATIVCAVFWILSFFNIKKTAKGCIAASAAGIAAQLIATVLTFFALNLSGGFEFISVKPLYGSVAGIAVLGVFLALNIILALNAPEIPVKEADRKRLEIKEKLKKGEITLDELPLPIVQEKTDENAAEPKNKKKKGKRGKTK